MRIPRLSDGGIRRVIGDISNMPERGIMAQVRKCSEGEWSSYQLWGTVYEYCNRTCCDVRTVVIDGKRVELYSNCSDENCGQGWFVADL
jgi:hypothetical protein